MEEPANEPQSLNLAAISGDPGNTRSGCSIGEGEGESNLGCNTPDGDIIFPSALTHTSAGKWVKCEERWAPSGYRERLQNRV